jgi:NADP-dependent 3-hydroxy acid dehydrogenase YdfG
MGTEADLAETANQVESLNRRCMTIKADVRRPQEMQVVAERAISEFGHIDFLLANAGIASNSLIAEMSDQQWQEMIDVNLTGVFHSFRAVVPHMIERGPGKM